MTVDPELDAWRQQWQARDAVPPELRQRVEREVRATRYAFVAPVTVTALFGGGTLAWAIASGPGEAYAVAAITWAFIAITWLTSFGLLRWIGHSRAPAAATATAFLEFTIQVCRGKRAGIVAAAILYTAFVAFMLVWRYQTLSAVGVRDYLFSSPVLTYAGITIALAVLGRRSYRALGAELDRLRAMQRTFDDI